MAIGIPRHQARHSGKSGFVTSSRISSPKPFPYSFLEDAATSYYPEYRKYVPSDYRKYSDSYYDLRSKPYKQWFDKWGKPHINKWWQEQISYETLRQKAQKNFQKRPSKSSYTYSKYNESVNYRKYTRCANILRNTKCKCGRKLSIRQNRFKSRPRRFQRKYRRRY